MTRKEIYKKLRAARRLMNNSGAHWTRGQLRRTNRNTGEVSYCMVGGVCEAIGVRGANEGYRVPKVARPALMALAQSILDDSYIIRDKFKWSAPKGKVPDIDVAVSVITYANDNEATWEDVRRWIGKAVGDIK